MNSSYFNRKIPFIKKHNTQYGGKNIKKKKIIFKKNFPLISIITVVYNNYLHIQKTLNSKAKKHNKVIFYHNKELVSYDLIGEHQIQMQISQDSF